MKNFITNWITNNTWFIILEAVAVLLLIVSFVLPPTGVIDNSVLVASSEIFAFTGLATVIKAIDKGHSATVQKGDTSVEIKTKGDSESES